MTDKQIIINKMDKPKRYCEGIDCAWCNEKEPCIYKIANELEEKLLRKEQECERLKEEVSLLKESNSKLQQIEDVNSLEKCYLQQLDQLKAENEQLKRQHQADKGLITSTGKMNYQLIQEYDKLKTDKAEALEQLEFVRTLNTIREAENRKLEQTLTEIKEIAEEAKKDICNNCGWRNTDSCDPEDYTCREFIKILQKISEVEECKP